MEKLISASHDGMILLISSHRDKNRDLISVLLKLITSLERRSDLRLKLPPIRVISVESIQTNFYLWACYTLKKSIDVGV